MSMNISPGIVPNEVGRFVERRCTPTHQGNRHIGLFELALLALPPGRHADISLQGVHTAHISLHTHRMFSGSESSLLRFARSTKVQNSGPPSKFMMYLLDSFLWDSDGLQL